MKKFGARSELQMKKGFPRFFILAMLYRKPLHGFAIMEWIVKITDGFWRPKAGNLYPLLKELTAEELVQFDPSEPGRRKTYHITEEGKRHLLGLIENQQKMVKYLIRATDPNVLNALAPYGDDLAGAIDDGKVPPLSLIKRGKVIPLYLDLLDELDPAGKRERVLSTIKTLEEVSAMIMTIQRRLEQAIAGDQPH